LAWPASQVEAEERRFWQSQLDKKTSPLDSERSCRICNCGWISTSFQKINDLRVGRLHGYWQSCVSILVEGEGKKR